MVLLPCESTPTNYVKGVNEQTDAGYANVTDYANAGGRVFETHYSYTWEVNPGPPLSLLATWVFNENDRSDKGGNLILNTTVNTTFPKGASFAQFLSFTGALTDAGLLPIGEWRHDATQSNLPAQSWVTANTATAYVDASMAAAVGAGPSLQHMTFNMPLDAGLNAAGVPMYCGRVVFSDFHVSQSERPNTSTPFERACVLAPPTPQEKALIFMFFDLASCVQSDQVAPVPPPR